jgi:uncharacterized protein
VIYVYVAAGVIVLVGLFYLATGWRVAAGLHDGALAVGDRVKDLGVRVRAVEGSRIVLEAPGPRQDIGHPGTMGLVWPGGYGRVGEVVAAEDSRITRLWESTDGAPPVCAGDLEKCDPVELDSYAYPNDPGDAGLEFAEVEYESPLGTMGAWLVPGGAGQRWAVMCHGWTAERRELIRMLPTFHAAGLTSLVIDYRNDPGAPRDPSGLHHFGLTEWEDLDGAVGHARESGAGELTLVGCSTGAALVLQMLRHTPRADDITALVLDSPNIVLADTFRHATRDAKVTPLMYEFGMWLADLRWRVDWEATNLVAGAEDFIMAPTLVFHGTSDATVPISESRQLAARVPEFVRLVEVPAAGHVMSWNADPAGYEDRLAAFLGAI